MKTLKWNFGIVLIRFGYFVRKHQYEPIKLNLRWVMGVFILKHAYKLRGKIPMKTWEWNHV